MCVNAAHTYLRIGTVTILSKPLFLSPGIHPWFALRYLGHGSQFIDEILILPVDSDTLIMIWTHPACPAQLCSLAIALYCWYGLHVPSVTNTVTGMYSTYPHLAKLDAFMYNRKISLAWISADNDYLMQIFHVCDNVIYWFLLPVLNCIGLHHMLLFLPTIDVMFFSCLLHCFHYVILQLKVFLVFQMNCTLLGSMLQSRIFHILSHTWISTRHYPASEWLLSYRYICARQLFVLVDGRFAVLSRPTCLFLNGGH